MVMRDAHHQSESLRSGAEVLDRFRVQAKGVSTKETHSVGIREGAA